MAVECGYLKRCLVGHLFYPVDNEAVHVHACVHL